MANVQTELDTVILAGVHISCMVLNILPTKNVYVLHAVERTTIPNMNIENYYYTECRENIINTLATVTRCLSLYICIYAVVVVGVVVICLNLYGARRASSIYCRICWKNLRWYIVLLAVVAINALPGSQTINLSVSPCVKERIFR